VWNKFLQWQVKPPEEEEYELEPLEEAETGDPSDPSVTEGRYPSTADDDLGPTSKYQAADLDSAPNDGESLWRGREVRYPPDDPATAYVAEPEFRKQASSSTNQPATVMETRSLWGLAWQVECPGLDEATVLGALTVLGREWIAKQLRQTPSISTRVGAEAAVAKGAGKDPAFAKEAAVQPQPPRVTTGELLGTMDLVPLLPTRVTGLDPLVDAPAYRTGYLTEFAKWLLLRRRQRDEHREHCDEEVVEKEEFKDAPDSIADALKEGCLNPTGFFEDETFADIAVLSSSSLAALTTQHFAQEHQKKKYENRPDGDDKYRMPSTA